MQFGIHCTCNVITSKSNYIKLFLPNYSYAKFTGPHLKFAKDNDKGNNLDRQVMLLTPQKYKKRKKESTICWIYNMSHQFTARIIQSNTLLIKYFSSSMMSM